MRRSIIHKTLSRIKWAMIERMDILQYLKYLGMHNRRNLYLIGTPMHTNVGDNAIVFAEIEFLTQMGIARKNIKEITVQEYQKYETHFVRRMNHPKRLILMHGGGNMGNQWLEEEYFRRHVMQQLPENPMIILPQTFSYSDDEEGREELAKSLPSYNGRKGLTIVAREKTSYDLLRKCYPDTESLLTPDIVLSMDPAVLDVKKTERNGVLFVMRRDGERVLTDEETNVVMQAVERKHMNYRVTDMITAMSVDKNNRKAILKEKLNEFASAELVVTDRLHAMVFAAISGTPCVVLKNNNHKIMGTYDWIRDLPYIRFADDAAQAKAYVLEFERMPACHYDYSALGPRFDELRNLLKQYT